MKKIFMPLIATALSSQAIASPNITDNLKLSAFVAPTGIYTSDNNFFGNTDDSVSGDYMEVGLIGRYNFTDNLSFVGEGLYKGVGASEDHPVVDFAFLDYTFYQDFDHQLGVRVGKVKLPYGLHNDTRDVPFTRSRVFLPQSIYFENFRDSVFSQKGIELRGEHVYSFGSLNWNAAITETGNANDEVASLYAGAATLADFGGERSGYFRLMYTNPSADLRLALSHSHLSYDVTTKNPMVLQSGVSDYNRTMLSAEYTVTSNLVLTAEAEINEWKFDELQSPFIENDDGIGYYIQASYKVNNQWDVFISHGATHNDKDDKYGREYAAASLFPIPAHQRFTKDTTLGFGYKPTNNCMLRMEYSKFKGTSILPGDLNLNPMERDKDWDMITLQASYRFDIL